jgi:hypothetical protein
LVVLSDGAAQFDVLVHAACWIHAERADERIAEAVDTSLSTIARVRKAFVEHGPDAALYRKRPTGRQYRKLDGAAEARLIALACSPQPPGHACWTMQLLADRLVELRVIDAVSDETVRRTLKKTTSSRG